MNNSNLRRQDTTKGPPLRILCLDGGGVRGYSMLILLQELMHRTYVEIHGTAPKRHEIPKPCDHFDLIAGTGTGGLIAMMLGRLRMDIETCKDTYVRLTKRVFETDKTFAGIPYRSTLFKASKLEEAIRECVREHTILVDEGNDDTNQVRPVSSDAPGSSGSDMPNRAVSTMSQSSGPNGVSFRGPTGAARAWGNPNALLYDGRENRTKTAVVAVYKGTPSSGLSTLLRSYDSRKEPAPEFNCTIWEAGRATSAVTLAFKPIQVGQSVFLDEGAGKYNPAPQILDEATLNEWPARDIGVFMSIGTGKRPPSTDHRQAEWWEGFVGGSMGDFTEARRRLISKIEACEAIHQYMMREHLSKRGVNIENYYRLNVEVGVGEFGMNEWNRLSDISTNTRMYIGRQEVQNTIIKASTRMAAIYKAKIRWDRAEEDAEIRPYSWNSSVQEEEQVPPPNPMAAELSVGEVFELDSGQQVPPVPPAPSQYRVHQYQQFVTPDDKFLVEPENRTSHNNVSDVDNRGSYMTVSPVSPQHFRRSFEQINHETSADRPPPLHVHQRNSSWNPPSRQSEDLPPPIPPKTPISSRAAPQWPTTSQFAINPPAPTSPPPRPPPPGQTSLPYPDVDGPPPPVNMAKKPQYGMRFER